MPASSRCQLALKLAWSSLLRPHAAPPGNRHPFWLSLVRFFATAATAKRRLPYEGVGRWLPNAPRRQKGEHAVAQRRQCDPDRAAERAKRFGHANARHLTFLLPHPLPTAGRSATNRLLLALALATSLPQPAQPSTASTPPQPTTLAPSAITTATRSAPFHTAHLPGQIPSKAECVLHGQILNNLHLQLRHATCCRTPAERDLLRIVKEKVTAPVGSCYSSNWAKQSIWHSYDAAASIIACSSYLKREDFVRCGYSDSFSCMDRLLCPRCCHKLASLTLEEFGNSYGADREIWYVVCSLSTDPDESHRFIYRELGAADIEGVKAHRLARPCSQHAYGVPFDTADDLVACRLLWKVFGDAIRQYTGTGRGKLFTGAVGGPELAVRFQPLRVLPHANFICWSPDFSADGARQIRQLVRTRMRDSRRIPGGLYPTLAAYRIPSPDDLRRILAYSLKPVALATAYTDAAERVGFEPTRMADLNRETASFLTNLLLVHRGMPRLSRLGRCHAGHRAYIGHVTDWRQAQRDRNAERRQRAGSGVEIRVDDSNPPVPRLSAQAKWEAFVMHRNGQPVRPRRSRFYYWNQTFLRCAQPPPWPPNQQPVLGWQAMTTAL